MTGLTILFCQFFSGLDGTVWNVFVGLISIILFTGKENQETGYQKIMPQG